MRTETAVNDVMNFSSVRCILRKTAVVSFQKRICIKSVHLSRLGAIRFSTTKLDLLMKSPNVNKLDQECGSVTSKLTSIDCLGVTNGNSCCSNLSASSSTDNFAEQQLILDQLMIDMNLSSDVSSTSSGVMDSHCHLQLDRLYSHFHQYVDNALRCGVTHFSVCGTCPGQDWARVEEIHSAYPQMVVPNFGLHPWWIRQHLSRVSELSDPNSARDSLGSSSADSWESQLERLLQTVPSAGVGECGLDKGLLKREEGQDVDWDTQESILHSHLRLASRYNRPVTLHCVGAWGRLLDVLTEHFTSSEWATSTPRPAVILHSCNFLPPDMVPRFTKLLSSGVYFSLSGGGSEAKTVALLRVIPLSQLLVETDSPDQLLTMFKTRGLTHNQPCLVRTNCRHLAHCLSSSSSSGGEVVSADRLEGIVSENARRAFGVKRL